ncbi:MAG TPA: UbiA family prenyltransferase, partial [Ktedonobacterales bacterium]|nr:UbiA family prenyltransferase [Ktedonobacterales bacterium]
MRAEAPQTGQVRQQGAAASGAGKLRVFLESIKFEHTIFALPFAYLGVALAARAHHGWPGIGPLIWVTLAMGGARTVAMAVNRLADAGMDALNPRTANRALPQRLLKPAEMAAFALIAGAVMVFSAAQLNPLCLALSPVAVVFLLGYSYTKRFTWLCHFVLGL